MRSGVTLRDGGVGSALARIDQYELLSELGGGGFGTVYLARDTVSGVRYAVKGLPPFVKGNREELENIKANFALVSRLHHPNIAAALVLHPATHVDYASEDVRQKLRVDPGDTLMVMEYAPGVTLSQWRKQFPDRKVPLDKALEITRQIALALDYAHAKKILHRDVKPANVMIETGPDGKLVARVLDFGLAAEIRSSMGRVSREIHDTSGTRPYMAPEQWLGGRQGPETDQYALAVMVYELVTGDVPFASVFDTGDPVVMMNVVGRERFTASPAMPKSIRGAIEKALAKKPEERFASCAEFVAALEGRAKVPPRSTETRRGWVWILVVVLVLAAVVTGTYFAQLKNKDDLGKGMRQTTFAESTETDGGKRLSAPVKGPGNSGVENATPSVSSTPGVDAGTKEDLPKQVDVNVYNSSTTTHRLETFDEKGRRAYELYSRGEGKKILETFSDYDAEMVPEIAYLKGVVYRDGFSGVKKDLHKTAQYFTIAANRGHVQAQMDLATMYAEGLGVSRDLGKFLYWSEKVADQGVADAAFNMGYLYFSGGAGGRIKVDYTKALKYLKLAADAGRFSACPYLGTMYLKGWGVKEDNMESIKWFKLGAEHGDALSENNLGYMYLKGIGTAKDTSKALEYFQKADAHGNSGAAMSLGLMYENGDGVPQDLQEARRLYLRAKEHKIDGAEEAVQRVDDKLRKGLSNVPRQDAVPSDRPRAVGILTRRGDRSRSSHKAVDENGKKFYEQSFELTQKLPIIRENMYSRAESGYLVAAGQFLSLCREADFSDLKVEEVESYVTGEYLVVTMKNLQLVKIAWEGMSNSPTEESRKNLRAQMELVWEALRTHPKSTDVFVAVQPGVVDMVPRWGTRFKSSKSSKSPNR